MDMQALFFPQGNDIVVTAQFPDISDGTGMTSEFYYKTDKTTSDSDPSTMVYTSPVNADESNPGQTVSTFSIPSTDNEVTGAFWWRVDVIDTYSNRRMAQCGTLLVEAV